MLQRAKTKYKSFRKIGPELPVRNPAAFTDGFKSRAIPQSTPVPLFVRPSAGNSEIAIAVSPGPSGNESFLAIAASNEKFLARRIALSPSSPRYTPRAMTEDNKYEKARAPICFRNEHSFRESITRTVL